MSYQEILEQVGKIAKGAGHLIRSMEKPEVFTKEGHANYVTQADLASQAYIVEQLGPVLPGAHFFAEENEHNRMEPGYNWVIDPIDGTTNFMRGYGHSGVSIGLVQDGEAVLGVAYDPTVDELFTAVRGEGAFCNGKPIHVADTPMERALVVVGTSPYYRALAEETFDKIKRIFLSCGDIRRSGSAVLDLCNVACGRCDGFYEEQLSPWDYTAAGLIVMEAGGKLTTGKGAPVGYEEKTSVLAGAPQVQEKILSLLSSNLG